MRPAPVRRLLVERHREASSTDGVLRWVQRHLSQLADAALLRSRPTCLRRSPSEGSWATRPPPRAYSQAGRRSSGGKLIGERRVQQAVAATLLERQRTLGQLPVEEGEAVAVISWRRGRAWRKLGVAKAGGVQAGDFATDGLGDLRRRGNALAYASRPWGSRRRNACPVSSP